MPPARRIRNPVTMDDPARRHQQIQAELAQIGIALPGSLTSRTTRCQRRRLPLPRRPARPARPLPHLDPQSRRPLHHQDPHPRRRRTAPPLLHRPPPPAPAHHRTRSRLHRARRTARSTRNAGRPARRSRDQPPAGERGRNGQNTGRSARLTREPRPATARNPWSASSVVGPQRVTDRTAGVVPTELSRWLFLILAVGSDWRGAHISRATLRPVEYRSCLSPVLCPGLGRHVLAAAIALLSRRGPSRPY